MRIIVAPRCNGMRDFVVVPVPKLLIGPTRPWTIQDAAALVTIAVGVKSLWDR